MDPRDPKDPTQSGDPLRKHWVSPRFEELAQAPTRPLVEEIFALEPETYLRRMPGRETFAWPGRSELVVKRFRGGEARDWWFDSLTRGQLRSPARREGENLSAMHKAGIRVPRVLGWFERRRAKHHPSLGGESALVMEHVPHTETLAQCLAASTPGQVVGWSEELVEFVARLHRAGWYHRDLYMEHFVLAEDGLVLLDVGRARWQAEPRTRWFVKDLAALVHSTPDNVPRSVHMRFMMRWLERSGRGAGLDFPRWVLSVQHKAARLGAHAPRHVHEDPA